MAGKTACRADSHPEEPVSAMIAGTDIPAAPRFTDSLDTAAREPGLRKGERTRRRVLWATAMGLTQASYAALSMDHIAEIAEISRAALYQYVGSKDDAVRVVLTAFQSQTLVLVDRPGRQMQPYDRILRTNRYYIDYFAKNAVFMERVRELHNIMPEIIREKQRVNRLWAERVMAHAIRHRGTRLDRVSLKLRVLALECMIDDVLRELYVIRNPDFDEAAKDPARLAEELTVIWFNALYQGEGKPRAV